MSRNTARGLSGWALAIGLLLFGWGLLMAGQNHGGVTCDGQVMRAGERCVSSKPSTNGTFEDLLSRQHAHDREAHREAPFMKVGGAFLVVLGAVGVLATRHRRFTAGHHPPNV